jgi:hypothetical protein
MDSAKKCKRGQGVDLHYVVAEIAWFRPLPPKKDSSFREDERPQPRDFNASLSLILTTRIAYVGDACH